MVYRASAHSSQDLSWVFIDLVPQKGVTFPGNKTLSHLKPLSRSCFFRWTQESCVKWCLYFSADIFSAGSCREQFNFFCRLISGNNFSSVSVALLWSAGLKRVLLSLWTAFCFEEWGYNCNIGRLGQEAGGQTKHVEACPARSFPISYFFFPSLRLALMIWNFPSNSPGAYTLLAEGALVGWMCCFFWWQPRPGFAAWSINSLPSMSAGGVQRDFQASYFFPYAQGAFTILFPFLGHVWILQVINLRDELKANVNWKRTFLKPSNALVFSFWEISLLV